MKCKELKHETLPSFFPSFLSFFITFVEGLCLCGIKTCLALSAEWFVFLCLRFPESSDEDEASGDEGLPDEDSDVS